MNVTTNHKAKKICEWGGCISGLAGAGILASHTPIAGWGFVLFLLSNAFMLVYGRLSRANGIVLMQAGFTLTSAVGIANWLFR